MQIINNPIDEIANYFGTKIALYFGWLNTYIQVPSLYLKTFITQLHFSGYLDQQ